jgi:hypothetical protein
MTADEKVINYISRAMVVLSIGDPQFDNKNISSDAMGKMIEIAKMIQNEELVNEFNKKKEKHTTE